MSFMDDILEKLGLRKPEEKKAASTPRPTGSARSAGGRTANKPAGTPASRSQEYRSIPRPISEVDVVKQMEKLSGGNDNWKVSIVELLTLLKIDSSREARNKLALELGCPSDLMDDSAQMNMWLHKEVLRKIAQHGGNIPPSLLD
jgi:hypothetical protein